MPPRPPHEWLQIQRLEAYIAHKVLPALRFQGKPFSLQHTDLGNRNAIVFLSVAAQSPLVVKGFRKRHRIMNDALAKRFLQRSGIRVPHLHYTDTSRKTFRDLGCYIACEEKIEGTTMADMDSCGNAIPAVARFYARLHAMRSTRWGRPTSERRFGFGNFVMAGIRKTIARLEENGALNDSQHRQYLRWFHQRQNSIRALKHFSLCHGDVNRKNIIIAEDGGVAIIDTETMKYMPFPMEFFRLQYALCQDSPGEQEQFQIHYFKNCPPQRFQEFTRCRDFYRACVLLELAWYYTRKLRHPKQADQHRRAYFETAAGKALSLLQELLAA